uniref:Neuron navigator 1 n=1 Tax=Cyprinus carpio TaxID=7962 RepID=A0A8C2ISB3_CYPCA
DAFTWFHAGGMLGGSPRGQGVDLETEADKTSKAKTPQGQAGANGVGGMAAKRGKSGLPQATPRAELKVYRAGNSEGRLPVPSNLRKQKSLTNLCVLTDAEKKMHLYQPKWSDDMEKPGAGQNKSGKLKDAGGGTGKGIPLSKNLSKSEHSLFQGKPKPFSPPSKLGKPSRIPKGPYAEVKPISKAQELADDSKSDDEILSSKAKANGKKTLSGTSGAATPGGGGGGKDAPEPEEGDKTFLKVDPELVVTVLGDLEQLLFSQMLDPESQRKRTVQNVLDLRQNLEDTMSSLRGSQLSHSMCYDSDETNARSISSLSNRSSPLSWRQGQSSPRLQAGDAPSSGVTAHSLPIRATSQISHLQHIQLMEGLDAVDDDLADLKSGYLSDGNLTGKSQPEDEDDDDDDTYTNVNHWDESSSISSGLSDGSDNLSSEEFNAGSSLNSLPTTPIGSRRNSAIVLRTDAEKRSLVESGLSWYSEEGKAQCRNEGGYDTGSLKAESSSKWKKSRSQDDTGVKGELRKPQTLGHPPSGLKKSRNPPVGVTSPITHTSQSMLKVPGVVDKAKMAVKSSGLQRSSSDAGKDRGEHRKPPSGLVRPSAGTVNSFGYKKTAPTTGTATVLTTSGNTVSENSAIVNKTPKTSGIPVKPSAGGGGGGRKTSLDVSNCDQGFMAPNARNNIQYRSLPRPAKSSTLSLTGGRPGARPVSSNMDAGLQGLKTVPAPSRLKEPGSVKSSHRASTGGCAPVNQTDREKEKARAKGVVSDSECGGGGPLKNGTLTPTQSALEPPSKLLGLRARSLPKPAHLDKVNSNSLDCAIVDVEDQLPPKVPPFSNLHELSGISSTSCLTPSPAPILNVNSSECFSSATVGRGGSAGGSPSLYPRLSGLHRSMEPLSLQMSVSPAGGGMTEPRPRHEDRGTDGGWSTGSRVSQHMSSQAEEDSKERRHSHTIVSLTETNSPPQFPSPRLTGKTPLTSISKRELESSQEKVANLTSQLSANANLVAAFEQSLALMTSRLQSLSVSAVQKDSELLDLRETIENLKTKNMEAQAVIQVALNNPDVAPKELRLRRQNSSESISSLNSITSHSSVGSLKDDAKKKKKKSWLRSSFGKAFSIKKGAKGGSMYSDIEEIATPDSSAPNSPKLGHEDGENPPTSLTSSQSATSSVIHESNEENESDEKMVSELRSELWEKEMKLTDIRLEALNSAHQLEQLQETMNNMQSMVESLKAENDQLKTGSAPSSLVLPCSPPSTSTSQPSGLDYISQVDPSASMGLSVDSIHSYSINQSRRVLGDEAPESSPCDCLKKGPGLVTVALKGFKEKCVDSLVFETLVPKPMMQHYISLLLKHRRLVLSGPSGTGKTYLTTRLAEYLLERSGREPGPGLITTFNMHQQTCKDLQLYLSNLANQIDRDCGTEDIPLVIILDDISDASSITDLVNSALTCKYHKCPYVIGTTNQCVKMSSNHGLHLSFRMVTFSNNVEPANGFLVRYLHRKLIEAEDESTVHSAEVLRVLDWVPKLWYHLHTFLEKHSTSDFLIGPCFFLSCPVSLAEFRSWFIDLWNQSIIPYLQEGAKDGVKVHGQKSAWEDPVEWVRDTLPWPSAQQDQAKLFHLPPPTTGPNSAPTQQPSDDRDTSNKDTSLSTMESDPLMAMLLKLQESANYIESPERDISGNPTF